MSIKRLGVARPQANEDTLLSDVNMPYFASVIATNLSQTETANLTIYAKQPDDTELQNAYIVYNFPLKPFNTLETNRFALNTGDELWVNTSIEDVSFFAEGIPQPIVQLRYTNGTIAQRPPNPIPGDLFFDTTGKTFNMYAGEEEGWQGILPSTGYNSVDGGNAFSTYENVVGDS
jgi:hypothetical protein